MSGIVGSRLNIRGSGLVGGLGTDGQVLTSAGAGQEIVFESVSSAAITAINNATANELVTVGSTTTELDAESGLTYTDGALVIGGTTPSLTIGDAGAEDTKIVFDGNAQDFHIGLDDTADDLVIGLGTALGTTPAIEIDENLKVNISVTTASTSASTGSLTTGGGAGIGADLYVGDDTYLITDSAVLGFGADKDTTLTHTDGTGLTLNSTNKLCFNDASQFVQGSSATVLSLGATDEIDLTATAIDINGTCDVSGTLTNGSTAVNIAGKQTMWIPSIAMTPTVSNGCAAIAAVETTSGRPDMHVLDFDKDSDEHAQFAVAFPKSWNLGTVTFQVFWSGIAATSDVDWALQGMARVDNESIDSTYGTAVVVTDNAQGAVEEMLISAESGAVTIAGSPGDDELTYFRIFRDVSGDAMAGDARLHGIKLFYTTDAKNDA